MSRDGHGLSRRAAIETPLAFSQAPHDMLVQRWGGVARVFPAVPAAWKDVTVHDFRARGAFDVSAGRKGGATRFVRVRSAAGGPLKLRHEIDLARDREVLVTPADSNPNLVIAPVAVSTPGAARGLP